MNDVNDIVITYETKCADHDYVETDQYDIDDSDDFDTDIVGEVLEENSGRSRRAVALYEMCFCPENMLMNAAGECVEPTREMCSPAVGKCEDGSNEVWSACMNGCPEKSCQDLAEKQCDFMPTE